MADENLELSAAERAKVIADRAAAASGQVDMSIIRPGMTPEDKQIVRAKILELWK